MKKLYYIPATEIAFIGSLSLMQVVSTMTTSDEEADAQW